MCGLAGIAGRTLEDAPDLIVASCSNLRHRGPDGSGQEVVRCSDGEVVLGHTRLSIIDLNDRGLQPMWSADRQFCLVYNGEIYNYRELRTRLEGLGHRFSTATDTEVLLAAWSEWREAALPLLTGMFAFAVVDVEEGRVTLARDAFGIKPLFFSVQQGRLFFASEMPALRRLLPKSVGFDHQAVFDYLRFGRYDVNGSTFFRAVSRVEAGHHMTFDLAAGRLGSSIRWWWPSVDERTDLSFDQAADELRERFLESVRLHLRSDVPLGAALSGGLDSSSIASAMRHLEPEMPIHTFSFVAPGTAVDEEPWIDLVNEHVSAVVHKVRVTEGDVLRDFDDMLITQGEPFGSSSIYAQYAVYRTFRDHGVTVSLDGQGADELLGGYHGYPGYRLRSLLARHEHSAAALFLANWSRWPGRTGRRALLELGAVLTPAGLRPVALRAVGQPEVPEWIRRNALENVRIAWRPKSEISREDPRRSLASFLRSELSGGGLESLLRHGDRNSMRWSVESRVPFLTPELAEFVLRLPEEYLVGPDGSTKRLLRAAMSGILPEVVAQRRDKIGFEAPEAALVGGIARPKERWLEGLRSLPLVNASIIEQRVDAVLAGRVRYSSQVWRWITLGRWIQLQSTISEG